MTADTQIEQRLTAVEDAVSDPQRRSPIVSFGAIWLGQTISSFKDEPAFEGVLVFGRAIRSADRPSEEASEEA